MAFRSAMASKLPLVIILGATGTGKTKLSLELAHKFQTEIISADSMQIYKGLDIVTAKATKEERATAPHHLIDILDPHQYFTVVDFKNRALKIIDKLIDEGKPPIVAGGTCYYIESIVYNILVENMSDDTILLWDKSRRKRDNKEINTMNIEKDDNLEGSSAKKTKLDENTTQILNKDIVYPGSSKERDSALEYSKENKIKILSHVDDAENLTNEEIHDILKKVDPDMAERMHVNNRRKNLRSIEVWLKNGRCHSEILAEQKMVEGQLRRPDSTILLWLTCDQKVLDERLSARVDEMLKQGLIQELLDFHERHNKQRILDGKPTDYTKGIFQTLGFKEFHDYLIMTEEQRNSEYGKKLLEQSIENMKIGTKRFAKKQIKSFRSRFLEHPRREVAPIYELDTTDLSKWNQSVKQKAMHIVESYITKSPCDYQPMEPQKKEANKLIDVNSYNYCEVCKRVFLGDTIYAIHMESNRHKKVLKKLKLENENEEKEKESINE